MIRYLTIICILAMNCAGCSRCSLRQQVNKASETAGEVIGEAAKGVSRGVENAFEITIQKKDTSKLKNIQLGKILLSADSSSTDNRLSVYIIYNEDFSQTISLKVFDKQGLEMGRSAVAVKGKKDQAAYIDFLFDAKTNIDRDCVIIME